MTSKAKRLSAARRNHPAPPADPTTTAAPAAALEDDTAGDPPATPADYFQAVARPQSAVATIGDIVSILDHFGIRL